MADRRITLRPELCSRERKSEKSIRKFYSESFLLVLCTSILLLSNGFIVDALEQQHTDPIDFSQHSLIEPRIIHARQKRAIDNTLEKDGSHATHIHLIYEHNKQDVILDLQLNDKLIPIEHFISYQLPNGDKAIKNFTKTDINLCNYQGKIRNNSDSIAAISTCNGVRGTVFDGHDTFYIENELISGSAATNNNTQQKHYLIRHSDLKHNHKCGYDDFTHDDASEFNRVMRHKRAARGETRIRGPYNADQQSRYVELVLVVDNKVFKSLDRDFTKVHTHCKDIANTINALYVPLNIFVVLIGVVVWNEQNMADMTSDGDKTLRSFLNYRKKILLKDHPNDNAQLLTGEVFEGGVVGKALKGPICTYEFSGGVSMDHSKVLSIVATTIAHEMGHNFGMEHDNEDCSCPDDRCIMSSSSSSIAPKHWSQCSIDQLNLAFHHGMDYCLHNQPTSIFESPVCGNGFKERGEDCDCGKPDQCKNSCCNPYTCKFTNSTVTCATGSCCDLSTCQYKPAATLCRTEMGFCDLPEFCKGDSEYCPDDIFKQNAIECKAKDGSDAFCYNGTCRSHTSQCKVLWGPSGASSDQCYSKNSNGSRHGNCGYDKHRNEYTPCAHQDEKCGMLQCRHLNERLEFGMESVAILSHSFINFNRAIIPCRTAIIDLGLDSIDPGLTPSGAICGDNKLCVDQKCLSVDKFKKEKKIFDCPDNCHGNGVCNSKNKCHCKLGYNPMTNCQKDGCGGSEDGGPNDPSCGSSWLIKILVILCAALVFSLFFALFIYYWRKNNFKIPDKLSTLCNCAACAAFLAPRRDAKKPASTISPPTSTFGSSSPNSPDDMNSSLLRPSAIDKTKLFGKFDGFTLKPIERDQRKVAYVQPVSKNVAVEQDNHIVPTREAPPPPVPKHHGVNAQVDKFNKLTEVVVPPPALPPMNKGSTARPLISHPILEASTCDAKELPNSVKYPTLKRAPTTPPSAPIDVMPEVLINPTATMTLEKKSKDGTLSRIQSFLKKESKPEKIQKQLKTIDKDKLRDIEISNPILITQVPLKESPDDTDDRKSQLNRTQSMRDPPSPPAVKPALTSFGSMRHPRPKSIVDRPTLPPPPRPPPPPVTKSKSLESPQYDSAESREAGTPDNIYAVIEESPVSPPVKQQGSIESMGLLTEIVNEIEQRKFDAIYIASTLKKKKQSPGYANVKTPVEEEYHPESNASTTSSGYMRPIGRIPPSQSFTATNAKMPSTTPSNNSLSSFKSAKSNSVTSPESVHPPSSSKMKKSSSDLGGNRKKSVDESEYKTPTSNKPVIELKKTPTPPSIALPKKTTSLNKIPSKPKTSQKPPVSTSSAVPPSKSTPALKTTSSGLSNGNVKIPTSNTSSSKVLSAAASKKSNVAALQQKFESANSK